MNADNDKSDQLDEMLAHSYRSLREPVPGEREAILAGPSRPQPAERPLRRRAWNGPIAWLATAACLAVVTATVALLVPTSGRLVYGVEAVPGRLAEVQTIRQRGYRMIYPDPGRSDPPIRVPVEYVIKRPDKFRYTHYTAMYPRDAPLRVETKTVVCDGQRESYVWKSNKECVTAPIGMLEAWIRTETRAQIMIAHLFGPPEASYRKTGREAVAGRPCDVYEGRIRREHDDDSEFVWRLWIDPTTGYPARLTQDEILPDGSRRQIQELEDIAVGVLLEDELFATAAPPGYRSIAREGVAAPMALDAKPTSSGGGGGKKLEVWHAFRITDNAALVVWRRSAPEVADDGTSEWLRGVTFSIFGDDRQRSMRHDWVYQSRSPDVWNWSLVAALDGPLPDRGGVRLELKTKPLESTIGMFLLRFPDKGLARIVEAAARATLPDDGPRFKLEHLRVLAGQLTPTEPN